MKRIIPSILCALFLHACGDGKKEAADQLARQEQVSDVHVIDLSEHDLPLIVEIDRNVLGDDTAKVRYNEEFGRYEVDAGERFRILIAEEEGDMQRLKDGLERDMLRKTTIIEESPGLIVYRSEFPADDIVFVHFYQIIGHEGRTFVIESHDQGRFNETDVRRMSAAVRPGSRV
jgi:hypothetical protein